MVMNSAFIKNIEPADQKEWDIASHSCRRGLRCHCKFERSLRQGRRVQDPTVRAIWTRTSNALLPQEKFYKPIGCQAVFISSVSAIQYGFSAARPCHSAGARSRRT